MAPVRLEVAMTTTLEKRLSWSICKGDWERGAGLGYALKLFQPPCLGPE